MREYKPSFLTGIIFTAVRLAIAATVAFIPLGYLIWEARAVNPLLIIPAIIIGIVIEFSIFGVLLDLITRPFKKPSVNLSDNSVKLESDSQNIPYDEVKSISIHLGKTSRHSPQPPHMTLTDNEGKSLVILRPSLILIRTIKKHCKNATFTVENLKKEVVFYLIIGLLCALLIFCSLQPKI